MANEENLVSLATRTTKEKREIAKKGGKKSGEVRAARKKFKEDLLLALETVKGDKTVQQLGIEAIIKKFIAGDMQAFTIVRDTVGEKPADKVEADVKNEVNINRELVDEEWT